MTAPAHRPRHPARDVSQFLAADAEALCHDLLPAGKRHGAEWVHASLWGGSPRSLSVHLTGSKAGVWADFAADMKGDALNLVAAVLFGGDGRQAYGWALRWLGLADGAAAPTAASPAPVRLAPAREAVADDPEAVAKQRSALRLWLEAEPHLAGTPAGLYLAARGIDVAQLGRQPGALRFHPNCWCSEVGATLPALLASVTNATGRPAATHRTWLAQRCGVWGKAPLQEPKKTLGRVVGGSIRLWRGATGKPLAEAQAGETVAIGEGIETCLSVAIACPELRVLCAVSLANLGSVALPEAVRHVLLAADNDTGLAAARGLQRAVAAHLAAGRQVRIARSPVGKDFNDCVRAD